MKNYTSLGTSPTTNYIRFINEDAAGGGVGGVGGVGSKGSGNSLGGLGGLGGLADNLALTRLEKHDECKTREIIGNSGIHKSIIRNQNGDDVCVTTRENYVVDGHIPIIIPFHCCLMDIVINNDLCIEIVDNSNIEMKNKVLASGKIRKYRLNGNIQDYDIFVEFENEDVYRVNKRGIMMKVTVSEEVRKLIINTMVNYVADGKDVDLRKSGSGGAAAATVAAANASGRAGGAGGAGERRRGWFGWLSCFTSRND
jgi:hypothetical protein